MKPSPSPCLRAFFAANPAMQRAWEMGRLAHEDHHEPQVSLDLAEHYLENADNPKADILTFFLAMSALQGMDTLAAREALGPRVAQIAQEIGAVNMAEVDTSHAASMALSPLAREVLDCIIDYMNENIAQARADALIAQRTEEAVKKMHYTLILQMAELEPGQKPN